MSRRSHGRRRLILASLALYAAAFFLPFSYSLVARRLVDDTGWWVFYNTLIAPIPLSGSRYPWAEFASWLAHPVYWVAAFYSWDGSRPGAWAFAVVAMLLAPLACAEMAFDAIDSTPYHVPGPCLPAWVAAFALMAVASRRPGPRPADERGFDEPRAGDASEFSA